MNKAKLDIPSTMMLLSEDIRINYSTPFTLRARCKFCGSGPTHYYYTRSDTLWFNPNRIKEHFDLMKKYCKRMCSNYYLIDDPKYFNSLIGFSFFVSFNKYRPKLHSGRGTHPVFDLVEHLRCECTRTDWAFYDKSTITRPEIFNRKSRFKFPEKYRP